MAQGHDGKLVANSTVKTPTLYKSCFRRDTGSHSGQCDHTGLVQESDEKYSL